MKKLIFTLLCISLAGSSYAATIIVKADGSGDYPTIQAAVDDANEGDIVEVWPGIYTGNGNRDIDPNGKNLTIRSTNPNDSNIVAATIIDCNGTETEPHRGFYFHSQEDVNSVLAGFTITNGYVFSCSIENGGGAICIHNSSPTISNCIITSNRTEVTPGCLGFCYGGGISIASYIGELSSPVIINCIITGNSVGGFGQGGGICCGYYNNPIIQNCIISENTATSGRGEGGGIYCYSSNLTIINCTITKNEAVDDGGGIWCGQNTAIKNCIIWDNSGDEIYGAPKIYYSDVQGGWLGEGNIDIAPYFVDPNNSDYHLKSEGWRWDTDTNGWTWDSVTSRCIDAGNPGCDPNDEPLPNSSNRINMGAYGGTAQASIPPHDWALLADLNNDGIVNFEDYAKQVIDWSNSEDCQPGDLDRDGVINMTDLALSVEDWLKETTWY